MANRKRPAPETVEPLLAPVRASAQKVARHEKLLAAARAERNAAIKAALRADEPPTHAQIAEAADLDRGQISSFARD